MNDNLTACLERVRKPSRYTGGEYNSVIKDKKDVDVRFAFCFPDIYEIGMSHLGSKILYGLLNSLDGVWCERVYAPLPIWRSRCEKEDFVFMRSKARTASRILIS